MFPLTVLALLSCFLSLTLLTLPVHSAAPPNTTKHNWGGTDTYFLYALSEADRIAHLSAMHDAGLKVVRIFITAVGRGSKGSSATDVPDLEPHTVGVYNDKILEKIDQLLYEAVSYGVKLDMSDSQHSHTLIFIASELRVLLLRSLTLLSDSWLLSLG